MQRRATLLLVAVAVVATLSGCSAAGSLDVRAVNETELASDASRSLEDFSPADAESERPPAAIVRAAVANGTTTATATSPPLESDLPFEVEGAYYDLHSTVVGTRTAHAVSIGVDYNTTGANGTAIQFGDLPPADRNALDPLFPQRVPPSEEGVDFGVGAIYTDAELEESVLAPVQQYDAVVVDGERYAIEVDEPRTVTVEIYRYEATRVAPNASAYAAQLRETYAFALSGLSRDERTVIETAIEDGGYYAESADDAAFEAVIERFRAHEAIVEDQASGTWLVRYDGTLYLADLRYGAFLGE